MIVMTLLTGCAKRDASETTEPPLALSASCLVFAPITAGSQDTTETLRQIVKHNEVYDFICPN